MKVENIQQKILKNNKKKYLLLNQKEYSIQIDNFFAKHLDNFNLSQKEQLYYKFIDSLTIISSPLDIRVLFRAFLKSLNKNYPLPPIFTNTLPNTFGLIKKLESINYLIDYYVPFYNLLSSRLIKNFEYLFKSGLILFLLANSIYDYKQELISLMQQNGDPLLEELNLFLNNSTYINAKVFDFLANNFILNSPSYINSIPDNVFSLFIKSRQLLQLLNTKSYIDSYLWSQIQDFLGLLSTSLNINLNQYLKKISFKNIEIWRKFFNLISQVLSVLNNMKSYPINSKSDLDNILKVAFWASLTNKKTDKLFYLENSFTNQEHKKLLKNTISEYQNSGLDYEKSVKYTTSDLFSSYLSYINSYLRKLLKNGDFSHGDFFHFFNIYLYSSFILELMKNNDPNVNQYKRMLASTLITKNFANDFYQILNGYDDQKIVTALEILKSVSQRSIMSAFSVDPNSPKDRTLYLRLNLWIKVLKSLPKDSNYSKNINALLNYLNKILSSYPNTNKMFLNLVKFENIDKWINVLDPIFNSLSSSNIAKKYQNLDYLFSQLVIYSYFKNKNNGSLSDQELINTFINNINVNDSELRILVEDMNFYNSLGTGLKEKAYVAFIEVLGNYYNSCTSLL